jgi:glycosyltransferase involved in cell wall biosynthesis
MLEAAACARSLVVSDVPGCRHFVRDGIEGLVVPPGDAAALAGALGRLASDASLRRKLGDAARERLVAGYTEMIVRRELRKAYEALARLQLPENHSPS